MAVAVLTPRIRLMTVCDGVRESKTEAGVFHARVHNMDDDGRKVVRKPTLQIFKAIPITDPAEQAELDRRCREAEKALAADRNAGKRKAAKRR
jgi:hypothetical protein